MIRFAVGKNREFTLVFVDLILQGVDPEVVAEKIERELAPELAGAQTVLFRGSGPLWLAQMLADTASAAHTVANFEPRRDGYIVSVTRAGSEWRKGELIPSAAVGLTVANGSVVEAAALPMRRGLVIAVGGPQHSGKTVLVAELYRQLLARRPGDIVLQRACPDGEGMWSAESNQALVQTIRQKGAFSPEFSRWIEGAVLRMRRRFALSLLDLGGKRMSPNDIFLRASTHLLVLSSSQDEAQAWVEYGQSFGCAILGVLRSRLLNGQLDANTRSSVDLNAEPIQGELVNLDRDGPVAPYQEAVSQLADWLIKKLEG